MWFGNSGLSVTWEDLGVDHDKVKADTLNEGFIQMYLQAVAR